MTHSVKRFPVTTICVCRSQHKGKKLASRRFRRKVRTFIHIGKYDRLPFKSIELTSPWDLGGDGKIFWGFYNLKTGKHRGRTLKYVSPNKDWWLKCMRK